VDNYTKLSLFNSKGDIAQSILFTSKIFKRHTPKEIINVDHLEELQTKGNVPEFQRNSVTDRLLILGKGNGAIYNLVRDVIGFEELSQVQ
jgi:hypothetical protein